MWVNPVNDLEMDPSLRERYQYWVFGYPTGNPIAYSGLPNVATGLSPDSPALKTMDTVPVQAPYHSIIGNRGLPGPLVDSSDGIVPYWSSHMDHALSQCVVSGPHALVDYPQNVAEMKRILHLHLKSYGKGNSSEVAAGN